MCCIIDPDNILCATSVCTVQVGLKAKMHSWVNSRKIVFSKCCLRHWTWNDRCWSVRQWVVVTYCHTWCHPILRRARTVCRRLFLWLQFKHQGSPMHSIIVVRYGNYLLSAYMPLLFSSAGWANVNITGQKLSVCLCVNHRLVIIHAQTSYVIWSENENYRPVWPSLLGLT